MKTIQITDFKEIEEKALKSNHITNEAYVYFSNLTGIIAPTSKFIEEEIQRELNLETFYFPYIGGSIIIFPQDIEMVVSSKNAYEIIQTIFKLLCKELWKKGYRAKINHNDLVIEKDNIIYKVAATVSKFCHISVNTDSELVQKLCKKKSEKIPAGLIDFGFTVDEIHNLIKSILKGS